MKKNIIPSLVILLAATVVFFFVSKGKASNSILTPSSKINISLTVIRVSPANTTNNATFTDPRDKHVYRQIKIGNQMWMAENLNYGKLVIDMKQSNNAMAEKSYYKNDSVLGKKFGALYTWEEATNYKTNSGGLLQGLCPDGWHLPSDKEWSALTCFLDNKVNAAAEGWSGENIALLLVDNNGRPVNFGLKFSGNAVSNWFFYGNEMAYLWTADGSSNASAWYRAFDKNSKQIYRGPGDIKLGMSIRCVKD